MPESPALSRVLREADDIARETGQRATTAHLLLALFTVRNHAERLLRERGIDEDKLLDLLSDGGREPREVLGELLARAAQISAGCGAREIDCLHALVALTRTREAAGHALLAATGENLGQLRTRALTILTGAVPRWLESRAAPSEQPRSAAGKTTSPPRLRAPSEVAVRRGGSERNDRADRRAALEWSPPIVPSSPRARIAQRAQIGQELSRRAAEVREPGPPPEVRAAPRVQPAQADSDEVLAPPVHAEAAEGAAVAPPDLTAAVAPDLALDGGWALSPEAFPWLTSLGRNLTAEAAAGQLDSLIGREREIEALIDVLGKRKANNPCLIGEPGVGKTAVVEGLALRLLQLGPAATGSAPLQDKIIVSLDVGALLVGTHLRGSFSEKLQGLKEEVRRSRGRVIVFFDELHTLVGAGSSGDGPQDAASELKAALARGDFPCIGATTHAEWMRHIEPDPALKRRFYPVLVREPSPAEALEMLAQIAPAYAKHHRVTFDDAALRAAVHLSARYVIDRHLPDKAIALLDLAGSRAARAGRTEVGERAIAELVAERTELPVERILASDRERLLQLESLLEREIVGHRPQLHRIAEVVRRNAAGFASRRPQGAFLFLGPTGVGKTETAKALARVLHGSEDMMIRLDLSEFSEPHAVARLVGAPPGYVGHDAGGQLTEAVRRRPGRVVLFDEIEKAHREVLHVLLQILDEGRLTDGRGQTVSFAETVVVLTSNLGADLARVRRPIGFLPSEEERAELSALILARAGEQLSPELWGRIEERLVFAPLARDEVREVARLLAAESSRRLMRERGISYVLDERAIDYLLDQGGFDLALGARPMRQILARLIEGPIAARILEGRLHADEHVVVSTRASGGLAFLVGDEPTSLSQRPRLA